MNNPIPNEHAELLTGEPATPLTNMQGKRLVWLQFPRRLVLLLLAFGGALVLLAVLRQLALDTMPGLPEVHPGTGPDWSMSWAYGRPITEILQDQLPASLLLLGGALLLAMLFAIAAALVALVVHRLEAKVGWPGSVLKGLGRLWVFGHASAPAFFVGLLLVYLLFIQTERLPLEWLDYPILPALVLALLPAALTGKAIARVLAQPRAPGQSGPRIWVAGFLDGLGILLGQTGGLLSASIVAERLFVSGVGSMLIQGMIRGDLPLFFGGLYTFAILVLIGRLLAECLHWLARLVRRPSLSPRPHPSPHRLRARKIWLILGLALLLIPLALALSGLTVDPDAAQMRSSADIHAPPSAEHPWGADGTGRDVRARVLRGGGIALAIATLVAVIVLPLAAVGGALTGFLASLRKLWSESVADLLLLPADLLLFLPSLPTAIVVVFILYPWDVGTTDGFWLRMGLAAALPLLPRAVRYAQALWMGAPAQRKALPLVLAGAGSLLLGVMFTGLGLVSALDYLGFGTRPPFLSLGNDIGRSAMPLHNAGISLFAPGIALWLCTLALYTAADALTSNLNTREPMATMNQ